MADERFLASIPLFAALDAEEQADLLRAARPFAFPAGHVIFEQGGTADGMYVLQQGRVQLWRRLLGEEQVALAEVGPGGMLGEFALIDQGGRSASAEVTEAAQGVFFSHRLFELLRADRRPAARKVMHELRASLCRRSRAASAALADAPPAFYATTQWSHRLQDAHRAERLPVSTLDLARLRIMPFFARFTVAELTSLVAPWTLWKLPRGHMIFSDGDPQGSAYLTVRGAVEVVVGRGDEWRRQAIVGPGRLFGLVAALDGGPRANSVLVRESALVLEIPQPVLLEYLSSDDETSATFVDAVHAAMSEALRATNRTLIAQSAMGRLARRKKRAVGGASRPGTASG
jgi:CRP/FNR family cyclic AMP-dependent transcriptional regulator